MMMELTGHSTTFEHCSYERCIYHALRGTTECFKHCEHVKYRVANDLVRTCRACKRVSFVGFDTWLTETPDGFPKVPEPVVQHKYGINTFADRADRMQKKR